MNNRKSFMVAAGFALGEQLLVRATPLIIGVLAARSLSVSEFSEFAYFRLTVELFASYATLGLATASARSAATLSDRGQDAIDEIIVSWGISVASGILAALAILTFAGTADDDKISKWMYAVLVPIIVFGIVPSGVILGQEKFSWAFIYSCISTITALVISAISFFTQSILWAVLALIMFQIIRSICAAIVMIEIVTSLSLPMSKTRLWRSVKSSLRFAGNLALVALLAGSGPWLLGYLILEGANQHQFALFAIGLQWYGITVFIPGIASRVLFASQVKVRLQGAFNLKDAYLTIASFAGTAALSAILGWLFQKPLMSLYGDNFASESWVIPAFMIAGACISVNNLTGNMIIASGRSFVWFIITLVWFLTLLIAFFYFSNGTASGAATSLTIASIVQTIISLGYLQNEKRFF